MKKQIAIILVLMLLMTGCHAPIEEIPQTTPTVPKTEPVIPEVTVTEPEATAVPETVVYEQQTMYAVSMPLVTEKYTAEDGNTVLSHTYQDMQLTIPDPDVADNIIIDFLNRLDPVHSRAEDAAATAQQQYSSEIDWTPHYIDICYSPVRIDQVVLSLYGTDSFYIGEGRPVQLCCSSNYNLLTGEVLTLGSILSHVDAKEQLIDLVIQCADTVADEAQLYDDYADYITERFDVEESFDEAWYFSETGVCFYFSPYEIAPYNQGIVTIEVPYSQLTGVILDDFFPPETEAAKGSVHCQNFDDADLTGYTQIAEIVTDTDGDHYFLYADGAVTDLRIETGSWEDGIVFIPDCTIFAAASLTPGDGIMIQTVIPEGVPLLRISYCTGDETVYRFLIIDGRDNAVGLAE